MATVVFSQNLARHLATPSRKVAGKTGRDVLEAAFAEEPKLASYLLDDQGALGKHVAVLVDGVQIVDRGLTVFNPGSIGLRRMRPPIVLGRSSSTSACPSDTWTPGPARLGCHPGDDAPRADR